MLRFTLKRLLLSVACFSVSFAAYAAIVNFDLGRTFPVWLLSVCILVASLGAGVGMFWGHPLRGAIIGVFVIPPAYIVAAQVAINQGWVRFP